METFHNVFQCGAREMLDGNPVVDMRGKWHAAYFHNDNPIVLELGCGRGEYTVGLAAHNPNKNYIGVDIKGARMWAGAKQAELAGMQNVAFLRTNIEMLTHFFAPNEVAEIWITFPDPQMKKVTKRLTSTYFMQRYAQLLRPDGLIHLKTDSPFLYTYTNELIKINQLSTFIQTEDLYSGEIEDQILSIKTFYEKQWLSRGKKIKYIRFALNTDCDLQEPDVEIEKDDYHSETRYMNTDGRLLSTSK